MSSLLGSDDHWFTLAVGTLIVLGLYVGFSVPWYWALVAAMLVSGVMEFAIKEVPPDPDAYDSSQYHLWNTAFGDSQSPSESASKEISTDSADSLEILQSRYARGELTDEQFEQKVEKLLETESVNKSTERDKARERLTDHTN
ncbi:SHOCT domain-containing protein [Halalkalicoccus subterraneus]|uniref:SHOCT domain-containing protein n=1 Tax=Halalkalicoccus subterraneus TaxID=2675002 RepID=UPI001B86A8F0|nr:SHOCT domain-containing protein [Halalkalicoccus subterraneus]